jgi:hypothetical protein
MNFSKLLAVAAAGALVMVGAGVAKADSSAPDPTARIVVPTDPVIEPCSNAPEGVVCFTSNSIADPVNIAGPTAQQLAADPDFSIETDFLYEPCGYAGQPACTAADTLDVLYLDVVPTIPSTAYPCYVGAGSLESAFNSCSPIGVTPAPGSDVILELTCVSTTQNPCTGMLPGQEGSAVLTPEPGALALLGLGIPVIFLFDWRRRKALELSQESRADLAAC